MVHTSKDKVEPCLLWYKFQSVLILVNVHVLKESIKQSETINLCSFIYFAFQYAYPVQYPQ